MNLLNLEALRVRRAAREPGHADTMHELEWLGGEALVAPLPHFAENSEPAPTPRRAPRAEDMCGEWIVL